MVGFYTLLPTWWGSCSKITCQSYYFMYISKYEALMCLYPLQYFHCKNYHLETYFFALQSYLDWLFHRISVSASLSFASLILWDSSFPCEVVTLEVWTQMQMCYTTWYSKQSGLIEELLLASDSWTSDYKTVTLDLSHKYFLFMCCWINNLLFLFTHGNFHLFLFQMRDREGRFTSIFTVLVYHASLQVCFDLVCLCSY